MTANPIYKQFLGLLAELMLPYDCPYEPATFYAFLMKVKLTIKNFNLLILRRDKTELFVAYLCSFLICG